jgi:hypothetical protein
MRTIDGTLVADLREALDGWSDPVAFGVGLDGAIYAAAHRSHEPLRREGEGGSFPKSRFDEPTDYLIVRSHRGDLRKMVAREQLTASYVQPYSNGVLLAGARSELADGVADKNAIALDWSGHEVGRFTLGDGIADVRVAGETIWVSYSDEGVFGNYGWTDPLGAAGLVAFGLAGEKKLEYDAAAAGTDAISDAYAMNVAGESDVWVYFYTDFPIVRWSGGSYRGWSTEAAGARAIAVSSKRVLLFGDYRERSRGRLLELGDTHAKEVEAVVVRDHRGVPLDHAIVYGVGPRLYAFCDRMVSVVVDW